MSTRLNSGELESALAEDLKRAHAGETVFTKDGRRRKAAPPPPPPSPCMIGTFVALGIGLVVATVVIIVVAVLRH